MWPAMNNAAPQMPAGRRPVCSQSRFMDDTRRRAVLATTCIFLPKPSLSANLCRYRLGSTGLQAPLRTFQLDDQYATTCSLHIVCSACASYTSMHDAR